MDLVKQIDIFGDSVMKGVQLDEKNRRYFTPKEDNADRFQRKYPISIRNSSKFGCTIEKGFGLIVKALERGSVRDMALLEYGGNDCDYDWNAVSDDPKGNHVPHTPLETFEMVYGKILRMLQAKGIQPLVMTLPPIDAEKYFRWICRDGLDREAILKWLGDVQMIYRFQELYSAAAVKMAIQTGAVVIDVRSAVLDKHNFRELLCEDGIHPNEKGRQLIWNVLGEFAGGFLREQGAVEMMA